MSVVAYPCRDCGGERTKGSRGYEWHLCTLCFTTMQTKARAARDAFTATFDGLLVGCPHCYGMGNVTCCVCHSVQHLDATLAAIALTNVWARIECSCDACTNLRRQEIALFKEDANGRRNQSSRRSRPEGRVLGAS